MKTILIITASCISVTVLPAASALAAGSEREILAENFLEADANADGALTLQEFTALIDLNAADGIARANMIKRAGRQSTAFGRIDANSDGIITTDELSAMAAKAKQ